MAELIDEATQILDAAYQPESSREDLAAAVGQALDVLSGEEDEDENDDDSGDAQD